MTEDTKAVIDLSPEKLKDLLAEHREKDYLLVDVRTRPEYEKDHIPGAALIPVAELESRIWDLSGNKDLIFYCRIGGRSVNAATLASELEVTDGRVYHLTGGILAWRGGRVSGFPRLDLFKKAENFVDILKIAMNLEKGARRFYQKLILFFENTDLQGDIRHLADGETAHAKALYGIWKKTGAAPPAFDAVFESLEGDIIEGGDTFDAVFETIQNKKRCAETCVEILEVALYVEYQAYDLYRRMAQGQTVSDPESRRRQRTFMSLCQAEKIHMDRLNRAVARCVDIIPPKIDPKKGTTHGL